MDKPSLFEVILARIAKENGVFNDFKRDYKRRLIKENIEKINMGDDIRLTLPRILGFNNKILELLLLNSNFKRNLLDVLYEFTIFRLIEFLEKENILKSYSDNLFKQKSYFFQKYIKDAKTIEQFVNNLKGLDVYPFEVINLSFEWIKTREGYDFWKEKHVKFNIYLFKILFNINK